ncbi:MAG: hypothetical protein Q8Q33_06700, partial [Chlamydiota bacterium]|nr:hypothetical protein [Chlamydiota bacterium]
LRALLFGGVLLLCIQTQFVTFKSNIDDSALGAYVISATEKCSLWVKQFAGESVTPVESQGEEIESEKIPETVPASGEDIEENDEATAGVERIPWL